MSKLKGWKDITKTLRVSHYGEDEDGAYIYVPMDKNLNGGEILWYLETRGWRRCAMHLDGKHYRTHMGRVYVREDWNA